MDDGIENAGEANIIHQESIPEKKQIEIKTEKNFYWLSCNIPAGACWVPQNTEPVIVCLECRKKIDWKKVGMDGKENGKYKPQFHSHGNNASLWDSVF